MPPIAKFTKEDIINTAYNIAESEGMESINARRIAASLGCSVQPIFHNFASMEDLNNEVFNRIYNKYKEYMVNSRKDDATPYKQMGLAYIKFAKDYPEFFKSIFMQETEFNNAEGLITSDDVGTDVINAGIKLTGLTYEEQKKFHIKVWIFTHGIACLVATKTVEFTDEEIDSLLQNTVREMIIGYKYEKGENK